MAIFTVTTLVDQNDGNTADGLSLREAIAAANASAGADTIVFDGALSGGKIALAHGEMAVTDSLTIDGDNNGDGAIDFAVDAGGSSRAFRVSADLEVDTLRLVDGQAAGNGGAIVHTGGVLTLRDAELYRNGSDGNGGAIFSRGDGVVLENVRLVGNVAADDGGAVSVKNTSLSVTGGDVQGNRAGGGLSGEGGGIAATNSAVVLADAAVSSNSAGAGGGIAVTGGSLAVTGGEIAGNGDFGRTTAGGGILAENAAVSLIDAAVSRNAAMEGGGLKLDGGTLTVVGGDFEANAVRADRAVVPEAKGSAIFLTEGDGAVSISETRFNRNDIQARGSSADHGAVYVAEGRHADIAQSDFNFSGGALTVAGSVALEGGSVSDQATGLRMEGGTATVEGTRFAVNRGVELGAGGSDVTLDGVVMTGTKEAVRGDENSTVASRLTISDSVVTGRINVARTDVELRDSQFANSAFSMLRGTLEASGNKFQGYQMGLTRVEAQTADNLFTLGNGSVAALRVNSGHLVSRGDTFQDNSTSSFRLDDGGAVELNGIADARFVDGVFRDNEAEHQGGAIFVSERAQVAVIDSTLTDNTAWQGGALGGTGTITVRGSELRGNTSNGTPSQGILVPNPDGNPVTITSSRIGTDKLVLGSGDDNVDGDAFDNLIFLSSGDDRSNGRDGHDSIHGGRDDDLVRGGAGRDALWGDDGRDSLFGDAGADTLRGGDGADIMRGASGDDLLFGGTGDDSLFGEAGNDTLRGEDGRDRMEGGRGNDRLLGGEAGDTLDGAGGRDHLSGEDGNDELFGAAGADVLFGGDGNDTMRGGGSDDQMTGGRGDDIMLGQDGNDVMDGGAGRDWLIGGMRNDTLSGGGGDDTLDGGAGVNRLNGGGGEDIFVLDRDGGVAVVEDFSGADQFLMREGARFSDLSFGGNRILYDGDLVARVIGVETSSLDAGDFIFL